MCQAIQIRYFFAFTVPETLKQFLFSENWCMGGPKIVKATILNCFRENQIFHVHANRA